MKLYSQKHLCRIGIHAYRRNTEYDSEFEMIPHDAGSSRADVYYRATEKGEQIIRDHNVLAALRGVALCRGTYKGVYRRRYNNGTEQVVWS